MLDAIPLRLGDVQVVPAPLALGTMTGTSISGPMTAANAAPLCRPKLAMATAMASSKLFDAAVNESVAVCS